jgi:uncharacterized CHY-type Zn-finger protein
MFTEFISVKSNDVYRMRCGLNACFLQRNDKYFSIFECHDELLTGLFDTALDQQQRLPQLM